MKNENKKLSRKQVEAITLRSGELGGLGTAEVAKRMSITERAVQRLLKQAEQICPQIFPLITKQEADVLSLLEVGWSNDDIAEQLDLSESRVSQVIGSLHEKGRGIADSGPVEILRYAPHMDDKIVEKF